MKNRLEALLRQREILREHAKWLEDEIASERARTGLSITPSAPVEQSEARVVSTQLAGATTEVALPSPPEPDVKGLHNEVRRGCFLYFFIAVAVLGGVIAAMYLKYGRPAGSEDERIPEVQADEPSLR